MFIVIDWTDGSWKKTQKALLVERLRKLWYEVEQIDFPQYGRKSAWLAENYLNGEYWSANEVTPYQASIFYAVDRYDAAKKIRTWLNEGKIVISDRYVSASMWHQAWKIDNLEEREKFLDRLEHLEYEIFAIPKPDINIFLYVDPDISRNLALKVAKVNMDKSKDVHENDSDHMRKASEAFDYVAKKYSRKKIYGSNDKNELRAIDDISEEVFDYIKTKI